MIGIQDGELEQKQTKETQSNSKLVNGTSAHFQPLNFLSEITLSSFLTHCSGGIRSGLRELFGIHFISSRHARRSGWRDANRGDRDGRAPQARWTLAIAALFALLVCFEAGAAARGESPPAVTREFRGVWIATVNNIDWPSKPGLSTREQQEELIALLDRAVALHLNAVIFQVRSSCDALYDSKIEPWSEYLTGKMGQAPSPYYDPLSFAVAEAHKRGLELHAWFNPYRVHARDSREPIAPEHISLRRPDLVREYGKYLWLDPTEPGTREYSLSVILDVVRRYDIDGVHFDDYFYPYPEKENRPGTPDIDFPDDKSWRRYRNEGGKMSRGDWRRDNVSQFIEAVYKGIKKEKPWVKFGISPFGIWRPGSPAHIIGLDSFDKLYGDARKWLADGWVDYLAPQLYWPIDQKAQSFPALLHWWLGQNPRHRNVWPGIRAGGWKDVNDEARELEREIDLTRTQCDPPGVILWHMKAFEHDATGMARELESKVYATPALVPAYPWLSKVAPPVPFLNARREHGDIRLEWSSGVEPCWQWVAQKKIGGKWASEILPAHRTTETVNANSIEAFAVTGVNRYGALSKPVFYRPQR
ncbi:MAG TPA: family 10 glycosylhydrolase [Verrucomicrobiae bacterium]|jgi:uncharacterized lipoprotein YddW (UPF0748 family)